jgi:hypothetical protein
MVCERSGSYIPSMEACANMSVPPMLAGCLSFPSTFVGRNIWLSTSNRRSVARPTYAVAKNIGRPGTNLFGLLHIREQWVRAAAWCRPSFQPWPAKLPSASGIRGARLVKPLRSALGKFAVHHLAKFFASRQLFQAAPEFRALGLRNASLHRWPNRSAFSCFAGANVLAVLFPFSGSIFIRMILSRFGRTFTGDTSNNW